MSDQQTTEYRQETEWDAFFVALAMMWGRPYQETWACFLNSVAIYGKVDHAIINSSFEYLGLKSGLDFLAVPPPGMNDRWFMYQMLFGRKAIIAVPSMKERNGLHFLFWDGFNLHDPATENRHQWIDRCLVEYIWLFSDNGIKRR
jgi:hypothetical protein